MIFKFMACVMAAVFMTCSIIEANEGMPAPVENASTPVAPAENVSPGAPAATAESEVGKAEKKRDLARRRHKRKHRRNRRRRH